MAGGCVRTRRCGDGSDTVWLGRVSDGGGDRPRRATRRSDWGEPSWSVFGACSLLVRAAIQGRCARCLKNTRRMCRGCGARLHANCFAGFHRAVLAPPPGMPPPPGLSPGPAHPPQPQGQSQPLPLPLPPDLPPELKASLLQPLMSNMLPPMLPP